MLAGAERRAALFFFCTFRSSTSSMPPKKEHIFLQWNDGAWSFSGSGTGGSYLKTICGETKGAVLALSLSFYLEGRGLLSPSVASSTCCKSPPGTRLKKNTPNGDDIYRSSRHKHRRQTTQQPAERRLSIKAGQRASERASDRAQ